MQHERRSGQRHAVRLSVELLRSDGESKLCRVHNLAPEGMLLENNCGLLGIGTEVELLVSQHDRRWNIQAVVTHCNGNCMGVMFRRRQPEFYRLVTQSDEQAGRSAGGRQPLILKPFQGKANSI